MTVLTVPKKSMLYCPKCDASYEVGTQRFCTRDGERLFAYSLHKSGNQTSGVFTNLLRKTKTSASEKNIKNESVSGSSEVEKGAAVLPQFKTFKEEFETPFTSPAKELPPENKTDIPVTDVPAVKTAPRLIRFSEVKASQAKLGDRKKNPTGRLALGWENTAILLGQTIKGRYYVVDQLSVDETSVAYLAEDKLGARRKVVVRVLMDEKASANDQSNKIFAEERVSLSHINHPNIAALFDSGELLEGKPFIVSEYVEGTTLKEKLRTSDPLSSLRAARVIRQIADALGEAHENGVLHRNLTAQNIILNVSPTGVERVKVTDFAVFDGLDEPSEETIKYFSPEQLEGRLPNFASDIYSLAVIAYQTLTGRFPFNSSTEKELLKAQKEGLNLHPTNLRLDLSPAIDEILEKALAYKAADRYAKAREFGDAFYNALTSNSPAEKISVPSTENFTLPAKEFSIQPTVTEPEKERETISEEKPEIMRNEIFSVPDKLEIDTEKLEAQPEITPEIPVENKDEIFIPAAIERKEPKVEPILEQKAPEQTKKADSSRAVFYVLGLLLVGIAGFAIWSYLSGRLAQQTSINIPQSNIELKEPNKAEVNVSSAQTNSNILSNNQKPDILETAPLQTSKIVQPPNTLYFQNKREDLKGDLAKNFIEFSFYYPNDWERNPSTSNFVDVARIGATGTPVEQFLVSYYDSQGSFAADREKFSGLVKQSDKDLMKSLGGSYRFVSEGDTRINGNLQVYEMKFQAEGTTKNGDRVTLWGRRLWVPPTKLRGIDRTGFVITMLATSLSPEIKSADDIGVKGELASVLGTFAPGSVDKTN